MAGQEAARYAGHGVNAAIVIGAVVGSAESGGASVPAAVGAEGLLFGAGKGFLERLLGRSIGGEIVAAERATTFGEISTPWGVAQAAKSLAKETAFGRVSASAFGRIVGWGRAEQGATAALARVSPETVTVIQSQLTKVEAEAARDVYRYAVIAGEGGQVAPLRLQLMNRLLELWK